jgi:ATPase family associated with various cellular activities (AAA)/Winged helix domain, variant
MNAATTTNWHESNQRYLMARLSVVRELLTRYSARTQDIPGAEIQDEATAPPGHDVMLSPSAATALDSLCAAFGLSPFECDVLLLCAGLELDSAFSQLCAAAQGNRQRAYPTFGLALAALPEAHWSALTPAAPLRRWRLIEVGSGDTLTSSPLRIDERVLHYLTGVSYLDARLHGLVQLLPPPADLPPSHRELAQRMVDCWSRSKQASTWPVIQLCGDEHTAKHAVAAFACDAMGVQLNVLRAADIPLAVVEREALARLWEREASLSSSALLLEYDEPENSRAALSFLENVHGMLLVASREPLRLWKRPVIRLDVNKPTATEQRSLWQEVLGPMAPRLNGQLESLVSQFNLGLQDIHAAGAQALRGVPPEEKALGPILWDACRMQARSRLDDLAQRIEPVNDWNDLVLPEAQLQSLRDIAAQVHQRAKVYESWGFASKGARGLGISALFAGASGTGKTMAAEVLAKDLCLDLYRIDLSQVVSKYIGETEKNLRRVFDAAEEGGAVLLFDEADALFGKRGEVKDSQDRYANIEVSYLLQRMEAYRGLAILTTNIKGALDTAFLRRIRFVVQFPFPDATQRASIWQHIFPSRTPTESLDMNKLARLNVAGGNIRNIALHAAFLAAHAGEPVRMVHLLRAARSEYGKLEKPLTDSETAGWL